MAGKSVRSSSLPKDRMGLKLIALFIGAFLLVFIGCLFYELVISLGESVLIDAAVPKQPAVAAIDPKLENDLAKVLELNDVQNSADIKDPFRDQSGISNKSNVTNGTTPQTIAANNKTSGNSATLNKTLRNQTQQTSATRSVLTPDNSPVVPQMDTKTRLMMRDERLKEGLDGGPEAAVFAIDDLLPVGVVGGGEGQEEVMFYSESACRVVSFTVGTQFYDGLLESLRPEGVVFSLNDQYRTTRFKSWGRSIKTKCSENLSVLTPTNQSPVNGGIN